MFAKDDIEFISGRLVGTIISHNNEPATVVEVSKAKGDVLVKLTPLSVDMASYSASIDVVDLRPVPLGFINFDKADCRWFCRIPQRAWKQGLTLENIVNHGIDIRRYAKNLRMTIRGEYPKFDKARLKAHLTAFHRDFAVKNDQIYYKDLGIVGAYEGGMFNLDPSWSYLQEYLHEVMM